MKRLLAMLLMFIMLVSVMPFHIVNALQNTDIMHEGEVYLLSADTHYLSAIAGGDGLYGAELNDGEVEDNLKWTYTKDSNLMNGNNFLCSDGVRLFVSESMEAALTVRGSESL